MVNIGVTVTTAILLTRVLVNRINRKVSGFYQNYEQLLILVKKLQPAIIMYTSIFRDQEK